MARLVAYQVQDDGNWDPIAFKKEDLKTGEVFILVVEERKELWIWIGQGANVRTRFISSTVAQEIRRLYGLTLRVRSADQGSEPNDFWICIEDVPEEGLGPTIEQFTVLSSIREPSQEMKVINKVVKKQIPKTKESPREKSTEKISKRKSQSPKKVSKTLVQSQLFTKHDKTKINTPLCPKCNKGYLLPYSEEINGVTIPIARWECSNCGYNPQA